MNFLPFFVRWCLGLASPETQTTAAERDCIRRYASGCKRLAEIGVWHGVTTSIIRHAMAKDGVLLAIDPFQPGRFGFSTQRLIAKRHVSRFDHGKVIWLRTTGVLAAQDPQTQLLKNVDFVFIDGDHSYEGLRGDWENWSRLVVAGGHIALHDSRSTSSTNIDSAGSVKFTSSVIRNDLRFRVVEEVDTLTVVRREGTSG